MVYADIFVLMTGWTAFDMHGGAGDQALSDQERAGEGTAAFRSARRTPKDSCCSRERPLCWRTNPSDR